MRVVILAGVVVCFIILIAVARCSNVCPLIAGRGLALAGPEPQTLEQYRLAVDDLVLQAQRKLDFKPRPAGHKSTVSEMCMYAVKSGKRIRGIIVLETARVNHASSWLFGTKPTPGGAEEAALAVEYLHATSLVIDDLPEFDNDLVRRGEPSVHAVSGKRAALLASMELTMTAFQCMSRVANPERVQLIADIVPDMLITATSGQWIDSDPNHTVDPLNKLALKTAPFFECAFVLGWLAGNGSMSRLKLVRELGTRFGIAYQLSDDLDDAADDAKRGVANYVNTYDRATALGTLNVMITKCRTLLAELGLDTPDRGVWDELLGLMTRS